jgi:hypothetical protein
MKGTFMTRPAGLRDSVGPFPHSSALTEGKRDGTSTIIGISDDEIMLNMRWNGRGKELESQCPTWNDMLTPTRDSGIHLV